MAKYLKGFITGSLAGAVLGFIFKQRSSPEAQAERIVGQTHRLVEVVKSTPGTAEKTLNEQLRHVKKAILRRGRV
ncbi:MAG: hypothetical protein ACYC2T_00535 [Bacillota bacterium]